MCENRKNFTNDEERHRTKLKDDWLSLMIIVALREMLGICPQAPLLMFEKEYV